MRMCHMNMLKFTIFYTTLVDNLPRTMREFLGANLLSTFSQDVI